MDYFELILLFLLGISSFTLSPISGGGGAMTLVPILNFWLGPVVTAPILNLAMTIGRPSRLILFWKNIDWGTSLYYVPAALLGVWLASLVMLELAVQWFQIVVGLFLISTVFQYRFGSVKQSFVMKRLYFVPLGVVVGLVGTLVGGLGPVLNPFYYNSGLDKEALIGTKTANSFFVGVAQVLVYSSKDILTAEMTIEGVDLGVGVVLGTIVGRVLLQKISSKSFQKLFLLMMVISGVLLLVKALFFFS